jgi:hypothetical protein
LGMLSNEINRLEVPARLNGTPIAAGGELTIYQLVLPDTLQMLPYRQQ